VLPVVTTLTLGHTFEIHNNSTGSLTINSSGSNLVGTIQANTTAVCTCILVTGTTAASWDFNVTGFTSALPTTRGGTGLTTIGTAGQALVVNSGATALEYATAGSSDFVKLATTTVSSNTASVSIDGYFNDTTYNYYILSIRGLRIDDESGNFPNMRFNVGGTADTTASAYYTMQLQTYSGSGTGATSATRATYNDSYFQMNTTWADFYITYPQISSNYEVKIYNPSSSSLYKNMIFTSVHSTKDPEWLICDSGVGMFKRTNVVTGITWLNQDGSNISAGTFTLYGVKK
jgi:hypothetical protein